MTRIMELQDQNERLQKLTGGKEDFMAQIQSYKFIVQDYQDEMKKYKRVWENDKKQLTQKI